MKLAGKLACGEAVLGLSTPGALQTTGECLRRNFLSMLDSCCKLDAHALSREDLRHADALHKLPEAAQSLLLRLVLRKGPWFRVDRLSYEDVDDCDAAVEALKEAALVEVLAPTEAECLYGMVHKPIASMHGSQADCHGFIRTTDSRQTR
jgi:hypothetical protein